MRSIFTVLGILLMAAFGLLSLSSSASAQETAYTSPKGDYVVEFPSSMWRVTDEPDDVHQYTEFVYGDRNDGYLRLRKESMEPGITIQEFARRDQDQRMRFLPGYVIGKEDPFRGRQTGVTISYEFTERGKPMTGRTYYLQGDGNSVYVLRFTGLRDKLLRIRNQTDSIARSLRAK